MPLLQSELAILIWILNVGAIFAISTSYASYVNKPFLEISSDWLQIHSVSSKDFGDEKLEKSSTSVIPDRCGIVPNVAVLGRGSCLRL